MKPLLLFLLTLSAFAESLTWDNNPASDGVIAYKSFDMGPCDAEVSVSDGIHTDPKAARNSTERFACISPLAKFNNSPVVQFRTPMLNPSRKPAFVQHVTTIIGSRPQKEMRRVDARRVVAFVQNTLTVRDDPIMDLPGYPMGEPWYPIDAYLAVLSLTPEPNPKPATFSLLNFFNKSFIKCGLGEWVMVEMSTSWD